MCHVFNQIVAWISHMYLACLKKPTRNNTNRVSTLTCHLSDHREPKTWYGCTPNPIHRRTQTASLSKLPTRSTRWLAASATNPPCPSKTVPRDPFPPGPKPTLDNHLIFITKILLSKAFVLLINTPYKYSTPVIRTLANPHRCKILF